MSSQFADGSYLDERGNWNEHTPVAICEVIHFGRAKLITLTRTAVKREDFDLTHWGTGEASALWWLNR